MTLKADVLARIPEQILINLTRLVDTDPAGVNDTTLTNAVSDAEGVFKHHTRVDYDSSNNMHVNYGVRLVKAILKTYSHSDIDENEKIMRQIEARLKDLGETQGADRITPVTDSEYTRSDAPEGRPPFDDQDFDGIAP